MSAEYSEIFSRSFPAKVAVKNGATLTGEGFYANARENPRSFAAKTFLPLTGVAWGSPQKVPARTQSPNIELEGN